MNPESPTPREQLEARLTALLLGELPPDESAALQEIIAKDAQLATLHARLKQTIDLVHETAVDPGQLAAEPPAPRRLGEERRQKLLAQFKTVTPQEFARTKPQRSPRRFILEMAAVIALIGVLASLMLPALSASKSRSTRIMVINNLRQIDGAKQQWAEDNKKGPQDVPTLEEILPYMGRGPDATLPKTSLGETYVIGRVGESPRAELDETKARRMTGSSIVVLPSTAAGKEQVMLAGEAAQLSELQRQKPGEAAPEAVAARLGPMPAGAARPEHRAPKQETIVLPTTVDTDQLAGGGNARDIKLVDNYNLNPVALSDTAKKEPSLENKDARKVQDLALLSGDVQDKLSTANDVRLGERIEKEKESVVEAPVALGVDKTAVNFNESYAQGLKGAIEGKNVVAGVAGHGAVQAGTDLFGLNPPGANGQTAASTPPSVAPTGGSVVTFQNSAPGPIYWASGGGRGGGGFGGSGAGTGQPGNPNAQVAFDGSTSLYPSKNTGPAASAETPRRAKALQQDISGTRAPMPQTPALASARPAPTTEVSSFDNAGVLVVPMTNSFTGRFSYFTDLSSSSTEQKQLAERPQTPQQDALHEPEVTTQSGRRSITLMSDNRTVGEVSNLVAQLDTSVAKTQAGFKFEPITDAITTEDRPLAKPATPPSEPQPEVQVSENAFSTFSLNVSDVSFKLAAASLERGLMPDAGSVRSEEFINAFDYRDPAPAPGAAIGFAWERAHYPFAHNRDLLRFSVKTAAAGRQPGRPLNLVLLLDNSGSMERADRVAIIHEALRVLAAQLQSQDTISVVTFARTARLWVDGIPGTQAGQVLATVSGLTPEGGTDLGDALDLAYATAKRHYLMNGVNRVVLLTDGAANLGNVNPDALKKNVEAQRKQGIDLDCFGIGWEGYNDDLLEVLTRNGDGRYGFINTPEEAASGFAAQLAGALRVAASDVKVQVEFNPARVISYRQIGYAKHQLTKEQFRDNTVNAAQIGAAESGNALYTAEVNPQGAGPVCIVRVRYRDPGTANYYEHAWDVPYTGNAVALEQASPAMRLAATASAFSEWLASSPFAAEVTPDALLGYLRGVPEVYAADTRPAQLETMIREAKSLTGK
jgi:Mg-chelatase subunit ChlD/type II secretory pathway pseudopilin PulG